MTSSSIEEAKARKSFIYNNNLSQSQIAFDGAAGKTMSKPPPPPHAPAQLPRRPLYKQQSWSPDTLREEAWQRRKDNNVAASAAAGGGGVRHSKSLSEDDLDELKACIELGFVVDSPELDRRLSDMIPAMELYHSINKQYNQSRLSRSSSSSSIVIDGDAGTSAADGGGVIDPGTFSN